MEVKNEQFVEPNVGFKIGELNCFFNEIVKPMIFNYNSIFTALFKFNRSNAGQIHLVQEGELAPLAGLHLYQSSLGRLTQITKTQDTRLKFLLGCVDMKMTRLFLNMLK